MDTKERFLKEIINNKSHKLAIKLADRYLSIENRTKKAIKIIQNSMSRCREFYPYVNVPRIIEQKIKILQVINKINF